mmetsp:Transcript_28622/g.48051  ORF Transcript_28622/g.48051 Transcript_28622/m.48051 type:complete len:210 (-) Transcript_28622:696-1325(-)
MAAPTLHGCMMTGASSVMTMTANRLPRKALSMRRGCMFSLSSSLLFAVSPAATGVPAGVSPTFVSCCGWVISTSPPLLVFLLLSDPCEVVETLDTLARAARSASRAIFFSASLSQQFSSGVEATHRAAGPPGIAPMIPTAKIMRVCSAVKLYSEIINSTEAAKIDTRAGSNIIPARRMTPRSKYSLYVSIMSALKRVNVKLTMVLPSGS